MNSDSKLAALHQAIGEILADDDVHRQQLLAAADQVFAEPGQALPPQYTQPSPHTEQHD